MYAQGIEMRDTGQIHNQSLAQRNVATHLQTYISLFWLFMSSFQPTRSRSPSLCNTLRNLSLNFASFELQISLNLSKWPEMCEFLYV